MFFGCWSARSTVIKCAANLPGVRLVNMAASDTSGQTANLSIAPTALGGSSLWRSKHAPGCEDIPVPTTTIDDLVGEGAVADLVKIDVEGHEPYVLRGMRRLIDRSPDINIIMEMFSVIVAGSYGSTRALQEEIAGYGSVRLFVIDRDGELSEHTPENPVTGDRYVLLTRDPAPAQGHLRIDASALSVSAIYDARILQRSPLSLPAGVIKPAVHLFYGPYLKLEAGRYRAIFNGVLEGTFNISFVSHSGKTVLSSEIVTSFENPLHFYLPRDVTDFEVVGTPVTTLRRDFSLRSISLRPVASIEKPRLQTCIVTP